MLKHAARAVWKFLPGKVRLRIIRSTQSRFTVSAAAVVVRAGGEVLLLDHVLRPYSGWGLPGGFLNHGEQPEAAIRREILEETGLEMQDLRLFRIRIAGAHVEMLFTATADGEARVNSREIMALGWFTLDTVPADFSRSQRAVIEEVLRSEAFDNSRAAS